jgi:hypothetical protein
MQDAFKNAFAQLGYNVSTHKQTEEMARVFVDNYHLCTRAAGTIDLETAQRRLNLLKRHGKYWIIALRDVRSGATVAMVLLGLVSKDRRVPFVGGFTLAEQARVSGVSPSSPRNAAVTIFANERFGNIYAFCATLRTHDAQAVLKLLTAYAFWVLENEIDDSHEMTRVLWQSNSDQTIERFRNIVSDRNVFKITDAFLVDVDGTPVANRRVFAGLQGSPYVEYARVVQAAAPPPVVVPEPPQPPPQPPVFDEQGDAMFDGDDGGVFDADDDVPFEVDQDADTDEEGEDLVNVAAPVAPMAPVAPVAPVVAAEQIVRRRMATCFPEGHRNVRSENGLYVYEHLDDGVVPDENAGETCCGKKIALGDGNAVERRRLLRARVYACLKTGTRVGIDKERQRQAANLAAQAMNAAGGL